MIYEMPGLSLLVLGSFLSGAAIVDLLTRRIPNALIIGFLAIAVMLQIGLSGSLGLGSAIGGLLVALALMLPFYALGGMAAGDVKLTAAAATFFGPLGAVSVVALTLVWGALFGGLLLASRAVRRRIAGGTASPADDGRFPYAGAICAGAITTIALQAHGISLLSWN